MHTVRFGSDGIPTVRFGAVFRNHKTYCAVRCGFSDVVNPAVRFGAVLCPTVRFGAVFRDRKKRGAVRFSDTRNLRCGSVRFPISYNLCGAVNRTESLGETAP